ENKVKMNPGVEDPDILKPAGPVDPDLTVLAVQKAERPDGQPLALFASYGLHYVGGMPATDVSADYFGAVCDQLHDLLGGPRRDARQPFVPLLANACFGDVNNIDVRKQRKQPYEYHQMYAVADIVAKTISEAWKMIRFHEWVPLAVKDKTVEL